MDLTENFQKFTAKFLFLNCNDGENKSTESELNNLLNDLNSLDYEKVQLKDHKAALRLIESFSNIPATEESLIIKSCCLIKVLLNKQKIQFPLIQFEITLHWLIKCLEFSNYGVIEILSAMQAMFKNHQQFCPKFWEQLLSPDGLFFSLMNKSNSPKKDKKNVDSNTYDDILAKVIITMESLINVTIEPEFKDLELLSVVGTKIIHLILTNKLKISKHAHNMITITSALNILNKIATEDLEWCENHLGELIGISKSFMHFGLPGINEILPQKVMSSQQSVFECSSVIVDGNKGGKIPKTRKLRTVHKNKKHENKTKNKASSSAGSHDNDQSQFVNRAFDIENPYTSVFNQTSDSDFSESETGRAQNDQQKKSKLRLTAIALIGVIAKNIKKKDFYGYWHAILPSEKPDRLSTGLLNTLLYDLNALCKIQALQVTCVMLFGSKTYLLQAENSEKPPTSFMPFSISLGNMIVTIYETLTNAMITENSLPVLTQILKCLTVLIHGTPFTRLKSGFVTNFVIYIRKLVNHKDHTIQVAALMVMEFLISSHEITNEISECVGIPRGKLHSVKLNENKLTDSGVEEIADVAFYDEVENDSENEESTTSTNIELQLNQEASSSSIETPAASKMSWLLQEVLENLRVDIGEIKVKSNASSISVRIESLNVLTSMASHFLILKPHLKLIAIALKNSIIEDQHDIRLNCGKCLDAFGHAINTYLLENPKTEEIILCQSFWLEILPCVIEKIQDSNQSAHLRSYLCDFLSNIGVHIFERSTHSQQIQLISLLSGISCNEENTVRASAVRALAIYVFFPSLREDLCFVENTAESILKLINDSNSYVRVKASWSMANISDVLATNCADSQLDRISDDLLKRILENTIESANDSHKVKCNAVRSIGSLLKLITEDQLKITAWREICLKAIEKLIFCVNSGSNAKVKWNSCYAIGNMMKNKNLFINSYNDMDWQKLVFPSICNLIKNTSNFKVRTNGAASLIMINDRKLYRNHFLLIWISILAAMEQSDNLTDFNEYKHRDNLQEQLCLCVSHFIKIASKDDFILMSKELNNMELVNKMWCRVTNRIIPENVGPLIDCWIHLQKLINSDDLLNAEQKTAAQIISNCLKSPIF